MKKVLKLAIVTLGAAGALAAPIAAAQEEGESRSEFCARTASQHCLNSTRNDSLECQEAYIRDCEWGYDSPWI